MNKVSERLKQLIKKSGLSYRELEAQTKIPHSAIQRYASGSTDTIPINRLKILATALGSTAEYVLGWDTYTNEFIELFKQLTNEQQSLIISQIKGILNNN